MMHILYITSVSIFQIKKDTVAMKYCRFFEDDEGVPPTAIREISLLRSLQHKNIVRLRDLILEKERVILVFEYLEQDLRSYLDLIGTKPRPSIVKSYLYQLMTADSFCHSHGVLHRDIKPQNILLDTKGNLKLADFGFSVNHKIGKLTKFRGTKSYIAPEIWRGE